jgi:hypothetical protein
VARYPIRDGIPHGIPLALARGMGIPMRHRYPIASECAVMLLESRAR